MKLKGERDFKADVLYQLLSNEVMQSFAGYIGFIKGASIEDMNIMDDLVTIVEEEQPIKYSIFIGLLNSDFDLETLNVLIDIESKYGNLINVLTDRLNKVKSKVNIYNQSEVIDFIANSVYILKYYYTLEGANKDESTSSLS